AIHPDSHSSRIPFLCEKLNNGTMGLDGSPPLSTNLNTVARDCKKRRNIFPLSIDTHSSRSTLTGLTIIGLEFMLRSH
ncbi:MAG TPA: hypothetical protein PLG55_12130, partial [Methanospirillum sp.]|uniref:hypothetical protein n=1 Tax=Methanospirillum sp. TaxID=45200 RepID=UPI002C3D39C0